MEEQSKRRSSPILKTKTSEIQTGPKGYKHLMASMSFDDWRKEGLAKGPRGGTVSPISPNANWSGKNNLNGPTTNSKYNSQSQNPSVPNYIEDVDLGTNWYSPQQPVTPFGPPSMEYAREWDYPVGYNLNFIQQRINLMQMLRGMRASWGVLATIVSTRKSQLLRIPWTVQQKGKPGSSGTGVEAVKKLLRSPDGKRSYSQWTKLVTDDLLVLDAPCVYFNRNRAGEVLSVDRIDPVTIFPLIDDAGRRPDYPEPAFQQIIKGLPMTNWNERDVLYVPSEPHAAYPMYGYSVPEQIYIEASEAIRKTFYQLNFWAEGTIPDLIVTVPKEWTPRQIAMFQAHFDALLSGNLVLKSKVRFLPGDMKPFDVKNANGESLWSQRDETLIRLACYGYSVSPTPFIKQNNRATAQNAQESADQEGLYPFMSFWKDDIMDPIIERCGFTDVEFVFLPRPEPNLQKRAEIHKIQVSEGIRTRNETRAENGDEPIEGGDIATIQLGNMIVPVSDAGKGIVAQGPSAPANSNEKSPVSGATSTKPTIGAPQRGPAKPDHETTNPKLSKASKAQLRDAVRSAKGHLHSHSHLKLLNGNYPKGHIWIQGLDISIENPKGSLRGEKDANGVKWQVVTPAPYGYIRGTVGADGDQVDVYLGKNPNANTVWVIDQHKVSKKGKAKKFDEHKCFIGFKSLDKVLKVYHLAFTDNFAKERIANIIELSMDEFKSWLKSDQTQEPIASAGIGTLAKSDTISASTGLSSYSYLPSKKRKKRKSKSTSGPRWLELGARIA